MSTMQHVNGYVWQCPICPAFFTAVDDLSFHQDNLHNFDCLLCEIAFTTKSDFLMHFALNHSNNDQCKQLSEHLQKPRPTNNDNQPTSFRSEVNLNPSLVKCSFCDLYVNSSNYIDHIEVHNIKMCSVESAPSLKENIPKKKHGKHKIRRVVLLEDGLESKVKTAVSFRKRNSSIRNKRLGPKVVKKLQCDLCNKSFKGKRQLKAHEKLNHQDELVAAYEKGESGKMELHEKLWEDRGCRECNKLFHHRRLLVNHMELVHNVKIEYENETYFLKDKRNAKYRHLVCCDICGLKVQQRCLKGHLQTHTGGAEFKHMCPHCNKPYKRAGDLSFHIESNHSEGQMCPYCGLKLKTRRGLRHHLDSFHNPNRVKLKCHECDKEFLGEHKLRHHHSSVHLMKTVQHECQFCGKKFRSKTNLLDHINLHTREKSYTCGLCPRVFSQRKQVKHHERTKHGIYMNPISAKSKNNELIESSAEFDSMWKLQDPTQDHSPYHRNVEPL